MINSDQAKCSWRRVPLADLADFRSGSRNTNTADANGQYPFFVCSSEVLNCREFDFDEEAVIMAGNNADGVFHLHHHSGKFAARQRTYVITPKSSQLDCRWLYRQLSILQSAFRAAAIGTTTQYVTIGMLRGAEIPIPPLEVQRAIAEALSDVDALLGALDRLIAKKRDLKQAAMQQLLTGQTRLPGFHGEWEVKRLNELADIRGGGTPSTTEPRFWDGDIPWCTPTDITALNGHKYLSETSRMITHHGLKASSAEVIPAPSIVMTSRATIGECAINTVPVSTNQGFKNFVPFATTDVEFLYYLLATQKQGFISLCAGSTFLEIGKTQLAAYEVNLPSEKDEQTAIAKVLSEMDAELAGLEQRRDKTRDLKQAMMQELLTGRTRLV
ncbi:MAG: restriction endonuclease subunit S [Candidatus Accumulibacter sp.]|uniref:restriction endonuclease subunit S n=1 Tax=Accumulibacter sp. TaxID=2053492 RepID=UPI0025838A63|nr:restriction endonuclease subunit S [Accumulibacter sp.]MCM8622260.1 restriction endonuclease subunit S [Accumulibacter sp.]